MDISTVIMLKCLLKYERTLGHNKYCTVHVVDTLLNILNNPKLQLQFRSNITLVGNQ